MSRLGSEGELDFIVFEDRKFADIGGLYPIPVLVSYLRGPPPAFFFSISFLLESSPCSFPSVSLLEPLSSYLLRMLLLILLLSVEKNAT